VKYGDWLSKAHRQGVGFLRNEWSCGKGEEDQKGTCKLCDNVFLAYAGGTTNLNNNLEAKHPSEIKKKDKDTHKQMLIPVAKKCSPARSSKITSLIAEFILRDMRPISSMDGSGFQQLLQYMEPGYKPPISPFPYFYVPQGVFIVEGKITGNNGFAGSEHCSYHWFMEESLSWKLLNSHSTLYWQPMEIRK